MNPELVIEQLAVLGCIKVPYTLASSTAFSICTVVSDIEKYREMHASFLTSGFIDTDCEYLFVDNVRGNKIDAFQAYNLMLRRSCGDIIIFCHQDVELVENRRVLEACLSSLSEIDPHWGLCGNAGTDEIGALHVRISDPHGTNTKLGGPFPAKVCTLDENFIVLRSLANIPLSRNIGGFHLYGLELCLMATILGWNAYVIDFHLKHHSKGYPDQAYFTALKRFGTKYSDLFRSRWIVTPTRAHIYLSSSTYKSLPTPYQVFGKKGARKPLGIFKFRR